MDSSLIILTVSAVWGGSEIILNRTRRSRSKDAGLDKSSLRIIWITIALAGNLGILLSFQPIGRLTAGFHILHIAGLALIACGLLIRWGAILSLKRQFTVDVAIARDYRIIKNGLYRFVRHPAYAGFLLSLLGLALWFANYLSMLIIFVPICLAFLYRIRVEEEALIRAFGSEYLDYCASTKRLIPGIF